MDEKQMQPEHRLVLENRNRGTFTGVRDVRSFDEKEILLETEEGLLTIRGDKLQVCSLAVERGELELTGKVNSLQYSGKPAGSGGGDSMLARLFR